MAAAMAAARPRAAAASPKFALLGLLAVLGVAGSGCAESRRAEYEQILRGDVARAMPAPARFTAAFPESAGVELAVVDADG
jgi:hypothetical protein